MPYIEKENRPLIDNKVDSLIRKIGVGKGNLNYAITRLCHLYIKFYHKENDMGDTIKQGLCYDVLNDIVGVLECVKQELYRKVAADYEDEKCDQNGDIDVDLK